MNNRESDTRDTGASGDSINRRLEFEKAVSSISSRFIGDFDLEDSIVNSLADMGRLRNASRAYLFLFKDDGATLENVHEWCSQDVCSQKEELKKLPITFFSLWTDRLRQGKAVHFQSPSRLPEGRETEKQLMKGSGINSLLIYPLLMKSELSGFIGFESDVKSTEWTDDDVRILNVASDIIGRGIQQKRHEAELEKNRQHLEELLKKESLNSLELARQMHQLSILYDVANALNFIDDLNKLLVLILDRAIEIAHSEKASIMLYDEKADDLYVRVVRGVDEETEEKILQGEIECTRIKRGEGIAGQVFSTGESMIVEKATQDLRFKASKTTRVDNILCVPLVVKHESIGVINITNKKNNEFFTSDDLAIIIALANHAAVAIYNAKLYEQAAVCGLTKTFMRDHFMQRLDDELQRSKRYKHELSLVMVDLDNFKDINEAFGHQAGDRALFSLARIMKKSIRTSDFIGRYGGDEFVIALTETGEQGAKILCERVRTAIEQAIIPVGDLMVRLTLSIGIATFPENSKDIEELIRLADLALIKAKRDGRNRSYTYIEALSQEPNVSSNNKAREES